MTLFDHAGKATDGRAPIPDRLSFKAIREAVQECHACELHEDAMAAQALLGSSVRVARDRGRPIQSDLAPLVTITTHPSAILRQRDEQERTAAVNDFVADLESVADWLAEHESA